MAPLHLWSSSLPSIFLPFLSPLAASPSDSLGLTVALQVPPTSSVFPPLYGPALIVLPSHRLVLSFCLLLGTPSHPRSADFLARPSQSPLTQSPSPREGVTWRHPAVFLPKSHPPEKWALPGVRASHYTGTRGSPGSGEGLQSPRQGGGRAPGAAGRGWGRGASGWTPSPESVSRDFTPRGGALPGGGLSRKTTRQAGSGGPKAERPQGTGLSLPGNPRGPSTRQRSGLGSGRVPRTPDSPL